MEQQPVGVIIPFLEKLFCYYTEEVVDNEDFEDLIYMGNLAYSIEISYDGVYVTDEDSTIFYKTDTYAATYLNK